MHRADLVTEVLQYCSRDLHKHHLKRSHFSNFSLVLQGKISFSTPLSNKLTLQRLGELGDVVSWFVGSATAVYGNVGGFDFISIGCSVRPIGARF